MFSADELLSRLDELAPIRHGESSLSIHPYFGKVDPTLARAAISLLSKSGDLVLDPFCGSGTVIHDAVTTGRNAEGWDSSPLAVMISASKVLGINAEESESLDRLRRLVTGLQELPLFIDGFNGSSAREIPAMPRIRAVADWFNPNALSELCRLRELIAAWEADAPPESKLLAKVAFSRIITAASMQQGESTYRRVEKSDEPGRVIRLYANSIKHVVKGARAFNYELASFQEEPRPGRLVVDECGYSVNHGFSTVRLANVDSRSPTTTERAQLGRAELVVTSPPYLMSWDYGLYHKFRFYWLGFNLDHYEETEIGRHLRRKNDDVERYISDMTGVFRRLADVVKPEGNAIFVNAPSVVHGKKIDTNSLLQKCASDSGWIELWSSSSLAISGPHHGMYGSLESRKTETAGKAGKTEHLLAFRRGVGK
jgi:hypothetical protein